MKETTFEFIIQRIMKNAIKAKEDSDGSDFSLGKLEGYYEALDTIKNELVTHGLDVKEYGMDVDLDKFFS